MDVKNVAIEQVLGQMRALSLEARGVASAPAAPGAAPQGSFAELLEESVQRANGLQKDAARAAEQFQLGEPGVNLADVMIKSQKAGLAFEAVVQVRNRLITAYQDIMNMPV